MLNQENLVNYAFRFSVTDAEKKQCLTAGSCMSTCMTFLEPPAVLQGPRLNRFLENTPPIPTSKRIETIGHATEIAGHVRRNMKQPTTYSGGASGGLAGALLEKFRRQKPIL